eukprot:6520729-Pyramimonas_sp.AAC.1
MNGGGGVYTAGVISTARCGGTSVAGGTERLTTAGDRYVPAPGQHRRGGSTRGAEREGRHL